MADEKTQTGNTFFDGLNNIANFVGNVGSTAATFLDKYAASKISLEQSKVKTVTPNVPPMPDTSASAELQKWAAYVAISAGIVTIMSVFWTRRK